MIDLTCIIIVHFFAPGLVIGLNQKMSTRLCIDAKTTMIVMVPQYNLPINTGNDEEETEVQHENSLILGRAPLVS